MNANQPNINKDEKAESKPTGNLFANNNTTTSGFNFTKTTEANNNQPKPDTTQNFFNNNPANNLSECKLISH